MIQDSMTVQRDALTLYSHPRKHIDDVDISFVIPVMNEESSLVELTERIIQHVPTGMTFEVIYVDDGSTDASWVVISALVDVHPGIVQGIRFRSNRGKAAGLQTGFEAALGRIVFTMDGDLQDDPQEIPRFLAKIEDGFDLVSGWKKVRHDPWHKVLPSRVFNRMLSYFSRVPLHDHNCGFKCYRREVVRSIRLYGELHRMVPSLAGMQGFRVGEIPVQHHARQHGVSKYGFERFIRGFSDMLTIGFLRKYRERPSHFANTCAAIYFGLACLLVATSVVAGLASFTGIACVLTGLCFLGFAGSCFLAGLLSELLIRQSDDVESHVVMDHASREARMESAMPLLERTRNAF